MKRFLKQFSDTLSRLPKGVVLALGVVLIIFFGLIDHAIGFVVALDIFYVFPVCLVGWFVGPRAAIATCGLATASWLAGNWNLEKYSQQIGVLLWDFSAELGFFLVITLLVSALKQRLRLLEEFASLDPLTGVSNRRAFRHALERERYGCERYGSAFALISLDIDNFKIINDTFGHGQGDSLLVLVAEAIRSDIREVDTVGRWGGDEFVILLTEANEQKTQQAVGALWNRLHDMVQTKQFNTTFSIGALTICRPSPQIDEILSQVDRLMYSVKRAGKNSVNYARGIAG